MSLKLTNDNYYSQEASKEYFSVSQVKDFLKCEAYAMAKINGEWVEPPSDAMLIGSYVDSYFEGTLEDFLSKHPEMFTLKRVFTNDYRDYVERNPEMFNKKLEPKAKFRNFLESVLPEKYLLNYELKSTYKIAEKIIPIIEADELFMLCLSGEKQVIMTGEIYGAKWKIKMDSYIPKQAVVDLKIVKKIRETFFKASGKISFIEKWGYDLQLAVYQEVVRQNTGMLLDCIIAAADKLAIPDKDCILIPNDQLEFQRRELAWKMPRIINVKAGAEKPKRCGICDYCRSTKVLTNLILPENLVY